MPPSKVAFPPALVQDLEFLREEIGLTQKKLATLAGVAQGTYSNLILQKPVRAKSARALVAAIHQAAEQYILRMNRSEDTPRIRHVLGRAVAVLSGEGEGAVGEPDEYASQKDMVDTLDRFVRQSPAAIKLHPPGGAVPSDSTPYLARHDELIPRILADWPVRMLVRGPSHCGKSTALALLARRAQEKGIETAWFDVESTESSATPTAERDAPVASALCDVLQASWNLQRPRRGAIYSFARLNLWLSEELESSPPKPRLLIVDEVTALGGPAANRIQRQLMRHLSNIHTTRSVPAVGLAVGMTEYFSPDPMATSIWNPAPEQIIRPAWLSPAEVKQLCEHLRAVQATDVGEKGLDLLSQMLGGQPYLTHAALIDEKFRDAVLKWQSVRADPDAPITDELRQSPWYRRHKRHIRRAVCGTRTEPNDEYTRIIKLFHDTWSAGDGVLPDQADFFHGQFLKNSCLVRYDSTLTTDLYKLIATDLYNEVILEKRPVS